MEATSSRIQNPSSDPLFQPPIGAPKDRQAEFFFPDVQQFCDSVDSFAPQAAQPGFWPEPVETYRQEAIQLALRWTGSYLDLSGHKANQDFSKILFAGHQPELFHPGVWFKNFVLNRLAGQANAVSVNLVVDNDLVKSNSISVPAEQNGILKQELLLFDMGGVGVPFEEKRWSHPSKLDSLMDRVFKKTAGVFRDRELGTDWRETYFPQFISKLKKVLTTTDCLPHAFAMTRHQLEAEQGVVNLELPISYLCDGVGFRDFFEKILFRADSFQVIHNKILDQYRIVNHLKSSGRPVANLETVRGELAGKEVIWIELPFWIWSQKNPTRRRLFCVKNDGHYWLTDHPERSSRAEFLERFDQNDYRNCWETLKQRGGKVRTRALTTTMFSRLLLCDGFVHGIGGAIYDRITDQIAKEFFGVSLSPFLAATATRWLPFKNWDKLESQGIHPDCSCHQLHSFSVAELKQKRRQLCFQPEKSLNEEQKEKFGDLIVRKVELLGAIPKKGEKQLWHLELESINETLSRPLEESIQNIDKLIQAMMRSRKNRAIVQNREWSFLLYPMKTIEEFLN